MKKTLFTLAFATLASAAFAQVAKVNKSVAASAPRMDKQLVALPETAKTPMKNVSNGVYYQPQGGLYGDWDVFTGRGWGVIVYSVAPYTGVTFKNMCNGTPAWTVNGQDVSSNVDAEGNYVSMYSSNGTFYGPVVTVGQNSWDFGQNNYYYKKGYATSNVPLVITDSISTKGLVSPLETITENGREYSCAYMLGSLSPGYLYGSGTVTMKAENSGLDKDITGTAQSFEQYFPALASDLYVEYVSINGLSKSGTPIAEGKKLTAYITDVVTNERGFKVPGNTIYQTLYAESADTLDFKDLVNSANKGSFYRGSLLFSKTKEDALGIPTLDPFVIPANQEFCIVIDGFNDEGIDFGGQGYQYPTEYDRQQGFFNVYYPDLDETVKHYYTNIVANINLYGMFEKIYVISDGVLNDEPEGIELNKIRVSQDGKTYKYDGFETFDSYQGVPVSFATAVFNEEGEANYDIENCPDWVSVGIDESTVDYGFSLLTVECEALPAGVSGRSATIWLKGRGDIYANLPICIAQGDASITGVQGVEISDVNSKKDSRMFNLAGQQVGKNFKGIVVKDGKKFLKK